MCLHRQRNIYQSPRTLDLLRNCLSDGQNGGCKQRGQTATIWLKALLMPRLAVCSRDLHWHWINWTLLCDTMEVSMLRLAWLPIAQHVFQPALTGRLELISWKIVSSEQEQRLYRGEQISRKIVSRELNARSYRDFAKSIALLGATSAKFAKSVGKKMGSNMRPRYIQFRDIHDRDISGLHCIIKWLAWALLGMWLHGHCWGYNPAARSSLVTMHPLSIEHPAWPNMTWWKLEMPQSDNVDIW